ncbi:hypothetical protein GCM10010230_57500 [Streptomyces narbonensis]|nr:hypothetical protein GCM10010230_57500 [Streptomyces narbonensis]
MGPAPEQYGRDAGAPPGEPGPCVESVAAVVAAADEQHDPRPVHPRQQARAGGGKSGGGALHEGAFREAGLECGLGGPDGLHTMSGTHGQQSAAVLKPPPGGEG